MENGMEYFIINQLEQDFEALADEHEQTAKNEHLWALGANDSDTSAMHEENAEAHRELAKMYRRMQAKVSQLIIDYGIDYKD
jgi:hypothetical protein